MGYETYYQLEVSSEAFEREEEILAKLKEISGYDFYDLALQEHYKWYDWEGDMTELSKAFPDVTFELSGEGEETGDIWKARFKDGKSERIDAKIVWEDFQEIPMTPNGERWSGMIER